MNIRLCLPIALACVFVWAAWQCSIRSSQCHNVPLMSMVPQEQFSPRRNNSRGGPPELWGQPSPPRGPVEGLNWGGDTSDDSAKPQKTTQESSMFDKNKYWIEAQTQTPSTIQSTSRRLNKNPNCLLSIVFRLLYIVYRLLIIYIYVCICATPLFLSFFFSLSLYIYICSDILVNLCIYTYDIHSNRRISKCIYIFIYIADTYIYIHIYTSIYVTLAGQVCLFVNHVCHAFVGACRGFPRLVCVPPSQPFTM